MAGYNNVLDPGGSMPGMGVTAQNAAVNNAGSSMGAMGTGGNSSGIAGNWSSTANGQVFNTQTGQMQSPGMFGQGGMVQMGIGAISTLGNLWNSFQQNKIAKKSLALQERTFETNLQNQTKSYNTELEDRIRTRYASERRDSSEADSYIEKNKL